MTFLGFVLGFIVGSILGVFFGVKVYRMSRDEFLDYKCICRFCGQNIGWLTK